MLIKMNETASDERRNFIASGVRSFFRDDGIVLVDLQTTMKSVTSSLQLF